VSADPLRPTLDLLPPDLLVFSSDFPHQEGRDNAVEICAGQLDGVSSDVRDQFFGGSIAGLMGL
jgi:predicted TIM-barrel fold metal-dependent hydrolase